MGNSNSTNGGSTRRPGQKVQDLPTPPLLGQPHRSLRTKKKSLELPDLANLSITPYSHATSNVPPRGRALQNQPSNSGQKASIPIPIARQQNQRNDHDYFEDFDTPHRNTVTQHDVHSWTPSPQGSSDIHAPTTSSHIPSSASDASLHRSGSPTPYKTMVVHSSIPPPDRRTEQKSVLVRIAWSGGGSNVYLARAGDEDWKGRRLMSKEDENSMHFVTIPLPIGTHHLRFLVDDQWHVAQDLPTAVDDQGSLANYVAVGMDGVIIGGVLDANRPAKDVALPLPPSSVPPTRLTSPTASSSFTLPKPSPLRQKMPVHSFWGGDGSDDSGGNEWTDEIPLELSEAADEEDRFLQSRSAYSHVNSRGTHVVNGFLPLPQIPPAPGLPRYLEKLILNARPPAPSGPQASSHPAKAATTGSPAKEREGRQSIRISKMKIRQNHTPERHSKERGSVDVGRRPASSPVTRGSSPLPSSRPNSTRITSLPSGTDSLIMPDDNSVLPVPSHAVIHHLSTSAIRNDVLAVGETIRYHQKYVTTVYYKPTDI